MNREVKTTKTKAGNTLIEHPVEYGPSSWRRISIETVRAGQPRPYADSVYEYIVTFEGGTPSTKDGYDLPFAVKSTEEYAKSVCNMVTRGWGAEKDNKKFGQHYLDKFELIESDATHSSYRVVIVDPYLD